MKQQNKKKCTDVSLINTFLKSNMLASVSVRKFGGNFLETSLVDLKQFGGSLYVV